MTKDMDIFLKEFERMPSTSLEYAVTEKSDNVVVFEGTFGWSDIGSFDGLAEIFEESGDKNPKHINVGSKNIFAHSTSDKLIATLGVEDLVVVETADSILIQKRGKSQETKKIVEYLKEKKLKEIEHNLIVHRPWGKFEILIATPTHRVRKLTLYPGAKIELQSHFHRVEHWVTIKGVAKVTNGDKEMYLRENESTFIPTLVEHKLENPGKINLEIVEVQTGNYLEEDDESAG